MPGVVALLLPGDKTLITEGTPMDGPIELALLDAIAALAGAVSLQLDAGKLQRDLRIAQDHYRATNPESSEAIGRVIDAIGASRPAEGSSEMH